MRATVNKISSNRIKIDFEVETEKFEESMQRAYRKNVGKFNIPGFRRGKAPRKVIELQYGESIFYEDAIDIILPDAYKAAINEHELNPVDQPEFKLGEIGTGKPLTFSLEVYVKPDVVLGEYKGLEIQKRVTPVTDAEVNAAIERDREGASSFMDVTDRPVQHGDQVTMNFSGTIDGEPFDNGSAEGHVLIIGSGQFIPGFEDQLIGAEILKEIDVSVTFPDDYFDEAVRGKPALFKVTVTAIHEKELPELDDEFAKDVSEYETFAEYAAQTCEKLEATARENDWIVFKLQALDAAAANAQIEIPPPMTEDMIDKLVADFKLRMLYQGITLENYLKATGRTMDNIRDDLREEAELEVRKMLVIEAISKAEQIVPSAEEIDAQIAEYVERRRYNYEHFKETMNEDQAAHITDMAKTEKTLNFLADSAIPIENTEVRK